MKKFRDFESAREFVRALNLKGVSEWEVYCKSGDKPDDIPSHPNVTYKNKGWQNWGDFLGTGRIADQYNIYRSFTEAREFVRALNLKGQKEWREYCTSGNKPSDIPQKVERTYKKDFKGYGDWLGTGNIHNRDKQFCSFKEAREFVRMLKLKNQKEWKEYCKFSEKPNDIPSNPNHVYKNDFKGMGDWLGTGNIKSSDKQFLTFTEAREFVQSLGLKNNKEWNEYYKSGEKPDDIPSAPARTYKNSGWTDLGDWLGTGNIATNQIQYRSFTEAREFVRKLNLKGRKEWLEYCASGNKPDDIPNNPWRTYKEWKKK
jgi:hypothetical protein